MTQAPTDNTLIQQLVQQLLEANKDIVFDEEKHQYVVKDKPVISVTQLLQKHEITPQFFNVDPLMLELAAERGTEIHKEIEDYVSKGIPGSSYEFNEYLRIMKEEGLTPILSEFRVSNDLVGGTVDLLVVNDKMQLGILDIKSGGYYKESVAWQIGIYSFLTKLPIMFHGCIHLPKPERGPSKYIEVEPMSHDEVKKLFANERVGSNYVEESNHLALQKLNQDAVILKLTELELTIRILDHQKKHNEKLQKELKELLLEEMTKNDLKTVEFNNVRLTKVDSHTRTSVDTPRLRTERPDIFAEYQKTSTVKESLKITLRND